MNKQEEQRKKTEAIKQADPDAVLELVGYYEMA